MACANTTKASYTECEPAPPKLNAGQVFGGRYEILEFLGSGGMGSVYRAADRLSGDEVALKIPPRTEDAGALVEAIRQELRVTRRLSHPNVVRIYDIGMIDSTVFISLEYVDGETLAALVDEKGALDLRDFLPIFRQLCEALAYIHSQEIVHRDIKPANLMLNREGVLKLMDFGLARRMGETKNLALHATPGYIAPELYEGAAPTPASDLFAAAIVCWELLTGAKPFPESPPSAPAELDCAGRAIPGALVAFIARCLELDPEKRFRTREEFMQAANTVLNAAETAQREGTLARLLTREPPDIDTLLPVLAAVAGHLAKTPPPAALSPQGIRITRPGAVEISVEGEAEPKYSAPEMFQESGGEDAQSKHVSTVYVLGFIFYELLLGGRKFNSQFQDVLGRKDELAWLEWHSNAELRAPALKDLRPECPAALSKLIESMLEKQASKRASSMAEVHQRLHDFSARRDKTIAEPIPKKPRKAFPAAPLVFVLGVAAMAAAGYGAWRLWPGIGGQLLQAFAPRAKAPEPPLPRPAPPLPPAPPPLPAPVVKPKAPEPPSSLETKTGPMVLIPNGTFLMGSNQGRKSSRFGYENEAPAHEVTLPAYYIDVFEVMNRRYLEFCKSTARACPANPPWDPDYVDKPDYPVINVSWNDARDFCAWAGKQLPSEAQWERAAGGPDGSPYPWGAVWQPGAANIKSGDRRFPYAAPVGSFPLDRSAWGVMDMAGNVPEWTEDDYKLYSGNTAALPDEEQDHKTIRGGGFYLSEEIARKTNRASHPPFIARDGRFQVGFRCAVGAETALKNFVK